MHREDINHLGIWVDMQGLFFPFIRTEFMIGNVGDTCPKECEISVLTVIFLMIQVYLSVKLCRWVNSCQSFER